MARRLNVPALAIAMGAIWGASVLLITWLNCITAGIGLGLEGDGWFAPLVRAMGACYSWYGPSFLGGIWGGICGFIDGGVCGWLLALIYNRLATPIDE